MGPPPFEIALSLDAEHGPVIVGPPLIPDALQNLWIFSESPAYWRDFASDLSKLEVLIKLLVEKAPNDK